MLTDVCARTKAFMRRVHALLVDALSNPFHASGMLMCRSPTAAECCDALQEGSCRQKDLNPVPVPARLRFCACAFFTCAVQNLRK